jgi:hypothetical protein
LLLAPPNHSRRIRKGGEKTHDNTRLTSREENNAVIERDPETDESGDESISMNPLKEDRQVIPPSSSSFLLQSPATR